MDPLELDIPRLLIGERCLLRPYQTGDGQAMYEAIQESLDHLWPSMPWIREHTSPEESEKVCMRIAQNFEERTDLGYGMWTLDGQTYLGGTGLHRMNWNVGVFEIGYWIRKSAEGQGYVTDAARTLSKLAFDHLNAARVFLEIATDNVRSRAVPERLGFQLEGIHRNSLKDGDGVRHDSAIYAVIKPLTSQ